MMGVLKNFRIDTFPDPVGHFGAPSSNSEFCRRCGGERVTLVPLGWYLILKLLIYCKANQEQNSYLNLIYLQEMCLWYPTFLYQKTCFLGLPRSSASSPTPSSSSLASPLTSPLSTIFSRRDSQELEEQE